MIDANAPHIPLTEAQARAMMEEYKTRGTCTCPLCGIISEPWAGMWYCECGAITFNPDLNTI